MQSFVSDGKFTTGGLIGVLASLRFKTFIGSSSSPASTAMHDQKLCQVLKERIISLENENNTLRITVDNLRTDTIRSRQQIEHIRDSMSAANEQWSERLSKEKDRADANAQRIEQLTSEYTEAIEVNSQLMKCVADLREASSVEADRHTASQLSVETILRELEVSGRDRAILEAKCRNLTDDLSSTTDELSQCRKELATQTNMAKALKLTSQDCQSRIDSLQAELSRLTDSLAIRDEKLLNTAHTTAAMEETVQELRLQLHAATVEGHKMSDLLASTSSLQEQMSLCTLQITQHQTRERTLTETNESMRLELDSLKSANAMQEEHIAQLTRQIDAMEDSANQMVHQRIRLENDVSRLEAELLASRETCRRATDASVSQASENQNLRELHDKAVSALQGAAETVAERDRQLTSLNEQLVKLAEALSIAEGNAAAARRDVDHARSDSSALTENLAALNQKLQSLAAENLQLVETNRRLTESASICQELLTKERESLHSEKLSKQSEVNAHEHRVSTLERELCETLKEIQSAKAVIDAHKDEVQKLTRANTSHLSTIHSLENCVASLRRDLDAAKRNLDSTVLHITELEATTSRRDDERKTMQIEILQLRQLLKQEQQEIRNMSEVHKSMREAFERRAQQNQDVVNAADTRANALETELSEVISKYNSLAQSHKEQKLRLQQQSIQLAEAENSRATGVAESNTALQQRRFMYELNLRLAEQETIIRELTLTNKSLHNAASIKHSQMQRTLSVQPLNTVEGPIRHPKKLRVEQFSANQL